ncbi:hypothetical protein K435DRAFT_786816 [Dendrothele bispora CBS 962.96]|uniref:Ribosomal RNA methyltransferase FtsJ domain-containing protein n=1 Tax=Dendrothele bispora (strain CBS 962.96) TaxID=1314807 RepID=A0A4S8KNM3_DENBC|nr:hypothetical protein K435DRAFT_786816 [Dendrothele bispora CBS 962.96]
MSPISPISPISPVSPTSPITSFSNSFSSPEHTQFNERGQSIGTRLADVLIARGASELEYLLSLKRKGWEDENMDTYFANQRHIADNAGPELGMTWFKRMKTVFGEIDRSASVPDNGHFTFLDLGCYQLLISQLVIALQYVRPGGKLVVKLSCIERARTAKIVRLFDLISERIETVKPMTMHAKRGSFYLVVHGVSGKGVEGHRQEHFVEKLREVWTELTFGGDEGKGRFLNLEDLDFVVTTEDLVERSPDVWRGQTKGLEGLFRAKNVGLRGRRPNRGRGLGR